MLWVNVARFIRFGIEQTGQVEDACYDDSCQRDEATDDAGNFACTATRNQGSNLIGDVLRTTEDVIALLDA